MNKRILFVMLSMFMLILTLNGATALDTTNITAYYTFDQTDNLTDVHGNYDLTNTNSEHVSNGLIDYGYNYRNMTQFTKNTTLLDTPPASISVSFWFKLNETFSIASPNTFYLFHKNNINDQDRFSAWLSSTDGKLGVITEYNNAGNKLVWSTNTSWIVDTWYHIVITWGSTNGLKLYINTDNQDSDATATNMMKDGTANDFYIGNAFTETFGLDGGIIDEFAIFDKELNTTEIAELYNSGAGLQYPFTTPGGVSYHRVKITNLWSGNNIQGVNVTLNNSATNLTQADGIAYFSNYTGNLTFNATYANYFNITGIAQENQTVSYTMFQSQINFSCYEKITNNTLTCINGTIYPNADTYNFTINVSGYYKQIQEETIATYDNKTINVTGFYSTNLTLNSTALVGTIGTCNYTIVNGSYTETVGGSPLAWVGLINGTYNVSVDCDGFATDWESITIVNTTQSYEFSLYTTNSINITFRDFADDSLILQNITIQFIGTTAQTNITNTSKLYVDLLSPDTYTVIYDSDGYRQGKYIITVANRSTQQLTLYLQNSTGTSLILLKVQDKFGTPVSNAEITIQRYILDSWKTDQIVSTDFQGQAEGSYILSTVYYNHVIKVNDVNYFGIINDDTNKKIIYAEDVTNGLTFTIDLLGSANLPSYFNALGISTTLEYINTSNSSGYFRFNWDDENNLDQVGCLQVYKNSDREEVCNSCVTSESSTITCTVGHNTSTVFYANGLINGYLEESMIKRLVSPTTTRIDFGTSGYIIAFMILVVSFFVFLSSPTVAIMLVSIEFILFGLFGLIFRDINYGVYMVLLVITYLVATIKSEQGVNS